MNSVNSEENYCKLIQSRKIMLDIVLFALTSPPADLSISPSTNQVSSVAVSNIDGFTPNHLLQQIYGTKVLHEDVDAELSDKELELIAGASEVAESYNSDVIVDGITIISLDSVLRRQNDQQELINYINKRFRAFRIPIEYIAAAELSQHLRAEAPRVVKRQHRGFKIRLTGVHAGQVCYLDTQCTF